MVSSGERILEDLQQVIAEIEDLVKETAAAAGDGVNDATKGMQKRLARMRRQYGDLEKTVRHDVRRGVRVADRYVHDNAWSSIAAVGLAAFTLGFLLGRRD